LILQGKLELFNEHASLSIERVRSLLLHSVESPQSNSSILKSCDVHEYAVFRHLSRLGYRLRRPEVETIEAKDKEVTDSDPIPRY